MTARQALFFGVMFAAGGWFGGLSGYVMLSDWWARKSAARADRAAEKARRRREERRERRRSAGDELGDSACARPGPVVASPQTGRPVMAHQQPPYNQPYQQQPPYPPYGQQQPAPVYYQQPPPVVPAEPRHGRVVTKRRMGGGTHSVHATLTLFTCGLWAPVWFLAWLLGRGKTVTRY